MTGVGLERMECCVKSILEISHREPNVGAKDKSQTAEAGRGRGGRAKKAKTDIGVREIMCISNSHPVMSV